MFDTLVHAGALPRMATKTSLLRYAHPFFTPTPPADRQRITAMGGQRMSDFIHSVMGSIPAPLRTPVMDLEEIIGKPGVKEIQDAGEIRFQATGDTGRPQADNKHQEEVSDAMASDFDPADHRRNPAFFFHLGDVIYGPGKENLYRDEFYRPYMKYPGKILAIAGNHDGETFAGADPKPLRAFLANFCATSAVVPPIAAGARIFRQTMTQPGVFYLLKAPFLKIVALYSNIAEGPGDLLGTDGDTKQIKWLETTLRDLKKEKDQGDDRAIVVATHHPGFSEGGHSGSPLMLKQIDDACQQAGILPHALLAGHSHNYQRYTRDVRIGALRGQIPNIVAGCGGHNDSSIKEATGQKLQDATFEKSKKGFGYLTLTASKTTLTIEMIDTTDGGKRPFDKVTVDLAKHTVK